MNRRWVGFGMIPGVLPPQTKQGRLQACSSRISRWCERLVGVWRVGLVWLLVPCFIPHILSRCLVSHCTSQPFLTPPSKLAELGLHFSHAYFFRKHEVSPISQISFDLTARTNHAADFRALKAQFAVSFSSTLFPQVSARS
jgi:hypothetical protein